MNINDLKKAYGYTDDEIYGDEDDGEMNIIGGLCIRCRNANGPYNDDRCEHYNMPLYMTYRRYKCKWFKEINYKLELEETML